MRRVLALLALLLLAPLASAHAVPADFSIAPFAEPLSREGESSTLLTFDYRCSGMSAGATEPNMSVRFLVTSAPAWAALRVEPEDVALPECQGVGRATATLIGRVVADGAVTGFADVMARWTTSAGELDSVARVEVVPEWSPAFEVVLAETEKTAKPQEAVFFPATITNVGGMTKLWFEVVEKSPSLQVVVPNPVVLQAHGMQGDTAQIPFTLQTPYKNGANDDEASVTFRIVPSQPLDPSARGEPQEFTVKVHTKGMYVPAAQFFGVMAALGAAAMLVRRRSTR